MSRQPKVLLALRRLDRYIFAQCTAPLIFATASVTLIVWMTQSLQRVDLLVEHGSGLALFAWLSILIIPSLLSVVIPFALFGAALYALHKLHSDSEIAVMYAAGVGRWRIAAPLLAIAAIGACITLWVNLDLMPRSYRTLKQNVAELRADFASSILRGGQFTTAIDGFTIYVDRSLPGGRFVGVLINDYRNSKAPQTYMAQRGLLRETDAGPILYLAKGNIQRVSEETGDVDFIVFQETAVNISNFQNGRGDLQLELTERYLSELFNPDMTRRWDRENAQRLIAEGHNRLASPIYTFSYTLLAIYALIGGAYNRRGYGMRIALAAAAAGAIRITGFVVQNASTEIELYWLQYITPIASIVVLAVLLSHFAHNPVMRSVARPA